MGKTTLAKAILTSNYPDGRYLNWDFDEDRQDILQKRWSKDNPLLIFDELHKFPKWKGWIKGIYDVSHDLHSFLITGSARLDVYRRGGDSLLGRYHYWRLHPFTLDEFPKGISPKDKHNNLNWLNPMRIASPLSHHRQPVLSLFFYSSFSTPDSKKFVISVMASWFI